MLIDQECLDLACLARRLFARGDKHTIPIGWWRRFAEYGDPFSIEIIKVLKRRKFACCFTALYDQFLAFIPVLVAICGKH